MKNASRNALVLSGGGARGAYEAGVLRFLSERLAQRLGHVPRFEIVCGSSVGAIHAAFWTAWAYHSEHPGERLADLWRDLRIKDVISLKAREVLMAPFRVFGVGQQKRTEGAERLYGFFNTRALEGIVGQRIRWPAITENLRRGPVDSLCVAATEVASGRIIAFMESGRRGPIPWTHDPTLVARPVTLRPKHVLASAAIPVLFPAVRIEDRYFVDGGLRLNTPLAPALRLGADRVLVIALGRDPLAPLQERPQREDAFPSPAFLYGKVLNALMLDPVERDLAQMRTLNALLDAGTEAFGPEFLPHIQATVRARRGRGFRPVRDLVIRPSRDLGEVAGECIASVPRGELPRWARLLMRALPVEADTLSYLYFDRSYTAALVDLGYRDAEAREEELLAFFSEQVDA